MARASLRIFRMRRWRRRSPMWLRGRQSAGDLRTRASRMHDIPTLEQLRQRGGVCWSHPGYANKHIFARSDKELVCASLAAE